MRDAVFYGLLTLGFATWVTAHVALAFRLLLHVKPRWHGAAALIVPPLAPLWGFRAGFRRNALIWVVALVVYAAALITAKMTP